MASTDTNNSTDPLCVVYGLGYVGSVTSACLAARGLRVLAIDPDEEKVAKVEGGRAPVPEPSLAERIRTAQRLGRLDVATSLPPGVAPDIAMICVGTPPGPGGDLDIRQVLAAAEDIGARSGEARLPLVVLRSTCPPGTGRAIARAVARRAAVATRDVHVVVNPEFLRETTAVADFESARMTIVGADPETDVDRISMLYQPWGTDILRVSLETAEVAKLARNALHATKVAFANEIGAIAAAYGADPAMVMRAVTVEESNGGSYLQPGMPYGGPCLPKDVSALIATSGTHGIMTPLLTAVPLSNSMHLERIVDQAARRGGPVAVLGLSFKPSSTDVAASPAMALVECLLARGISVRVFDPDDCSDRAMHGAVSPSVQKTIISTLGDAVADAANVIICHNRPEFELAAALAATTAEIIHLAQYPSPH